MIFPPYQVPYIGNGMVIGCNAVLHVLISHGLAIGAFALIVLGELNFGALRTGTAVYPQWQDFRRDFLKFAVFTITIAGAVTGTGIWFTTMALAPRAISSMLRIFFWAWFFEYFSFLGEIVLLLIIYYSWDTMLERNRRLLGRLLAGYVALSFMSAVAITGNLGFMLTPGSWVKEHGFWNAFLNPSFMPQLITRLSFAFVLGSLIVICAVAFRGYDSFRAPALRFYGKVLIGSMLLLGSALIVYYSVIPQSFSSQIPFAVLTSHFSRYPVILTTGNALILLVVAACSAAAVIGRVKPVRILVVPAFLAVALSVAQFERVREFVRGPYIMPGHMYVNGILLDEMTLLESRGETSKNAWFRAVYQHDDLSRGAYIFAEDCTACHTISGINGIYERLQGRTDDGIYVFLGHTHELVPFMPPFAGSDEDRKIMSGYLSRVSNGQVRFKSLSRSIVDTAWSPK